METTQEIKVGDKVRLVGGNTTQEWDGLRAVVTGGNGPDYLVKMDAGDKRPDGYDFEPFSWGPVRLRSEDDVAQDPGGPDEVQPADPRIQELIELLGATRQERDTARQQRDQAQQDLIEFRQTVTQTAVRYAREYDWCSVVQSALEDMGLETTVEQRIRVSGYVTATVPVCSESGDLEVNLEINGESVSTYDLEVEFDTDVY